VNIQLIQNKIYEVRGQKVMLDFDLAEMYQVETKSLKRAVKRNIERFEGEDFMFEVTRDELSRCKIGTLNTGRGSNIKYLPFAFTELGVAMLSSVLHSNTAIKINRDIMRAFTMLRQYALGYAELNRKLEDFMIETNMQFSDIYKALTELAEKRQAEKKHSIQ
jgi:hypothetical protein